jgi:uncharacterized protein YcbK (DUF882 family)|tara:strand:- start:2044 stop:2601 length:558 start_codon:yes stop_codon:yes gene_type:complete
MSSISLSRRQLLKYFGATALAISSPLLLAQAPQLKVGTERRLRLHNLHTGEHINEVFWAEGQYLSDGLQSINALLRDHRCNQSTHMDKQLLNVLIQIQDKLGYSGEIEVISGYRSPQTNEMLRQQGGNVSQHSLHMKGKAIDIRIPGYSVKDLFKSASHLQAGGVGKYPHSSFVHVDTGRVRYWG